MPPAHELLSGQEYEIRHRQLTSEKQRALREVVMAKRTKIYERVKEIVESAPFNVRAEDKEYHMDHWPATQPDIDPVLNFYLELGQIADMINGTRQRFWPHEGNWKHVAESFHAAISDTDTRNPVLAAISDEYNPQILDNDKARLRSLVHEIHGDSPSIELTQQEQDRLFVPLSGRVIGKQRYVSSFRLEQLLQNKFLIPNSDSNESGTRVFNIEDPQGLSEITVHVRRQDYSNREGNTSYDICVYAKSENDEGMNFYVQVPNDLAEVWQSLFDRRTQKLLRTKVGDNPYQHPLNQSKEGTMKVPVVRNGESLIPVMHNDARVIAPESDLLDAEWLRAHMFTQADLERMKL